MYELTTTAAGSLLLDPAEVSSYLNLDSSYPELTTLMQGVQDQAEAYCARSFTSRTYQLRLDRIPAAHESPAPYVPAVELPMSPVASITSVETLDESDAATAINASTYYLADDYRLVFTQVPDVSRDYGGILITYVAGDSAKVPGAVKVGMMKALSTIFEQREDFVVGTTVITLPNNSKTFLDSYRKLC